ncbi:MAG: prepilin-type N-terminal cleavage/methylation domain-containing protein [Microbacterium chocolatum]|nr:prepilin-type N-terminal cleavage/methylation domain-containing protein [Microbacterium chocolatum]
MAQKASRTTPKLKDQSPSGTDFERHRSIVVLGEDVRSVRRGFTIVELLIVVVVIAILAAITIAAYNGIQSRSKQSAAQAAASQAATKIQIYATQNADAYPESLAAAGVSNGNTSFQYSSDNMAVPRSYCVTATTGNYSYFISSSARNPIAGACEGHGVNGAPPAYVENFEAGASRFTSDSLSPGTWVVAGSGKFAGVSGYSQTANNAQQRVRYDPLRSFSGGAYVEAMVRLDTTTALVGVSLISATTGDSIQILLDDRSTGSALRIRENFATTATTGSDLRGYTGMIGTWFRLRLELNSDNVITGYMYDVNGVELATTRRITSLRLGEVHPGIATYNLGSFDDVQAGKL